MSTHKLHFHLGKTVTSLILLLFCTIRVVSGAGITVITHGFQLAPVDEEHGWVEAMGDAVADRAGGTPYIYRLVITGTSALDLAATLSPQNAGLPPIEQSQNAEIVVKVYWDQVAGLTPVVGTPFIASKIVEKLAELGHGLELPIHLIGHSRGSSVVSEVARILGQNGIWVHQLTMLDPHPIAVDAPVQVWETVLYADDYYQITSDPVPSGAYVNGSNYRFLSLAPGAYPILDGGPHSDIHLWYQGTVNTISAASDGNHAFTPTMRQNWYSPDTGQGASSGFYFSRLGGGQTDDTGPYFGLYNEGDFNNSPDNRVPLATKNPNEWPALIQLSHDSAGSVKAGEAFSVKYVFQSYDSSSVVLLYLDPDQNPYNGNQTVLSLTPDPNPQTATSRGTRTINTGAVVPSSTPAGLYYVYGKITNPNGTQYLYSLSKIQVLAASGSIPAIASVYPTTFVQSASQQPFQIFGSGFTSSSTLLFNGSIESDPARLHFKNENEIDYDLIIQSAGTWNVQVMNGAQPSNSKNFVVNNPPATVGNLVVNISPSNIGGQWQVDGTGYNNSGQVVGYLTPGSHTISFKPIAGYVAPPNKTVSISANSQTTASGTYTTTAPTTHTLTLTPSGGQGGISPSPVGSWNGSGYVYNAGTVVQLTAAPATGYHFVSWGGDASGGLSPTMVTMDGEKNVSATFAAGDPNLGTLTVTVQPPAAASAGVTWGFNANDFRASGSSYTSYPESVILTIHPVDGWLGPQSLPVTITAGQTANYTVTFSPDTTPGLLTVTLSPPDAVTAGAKWHVNNGPAQGNGATVSLAPGSGYNVTFDSISGWTAPTSQSVTITRAQTKVVNASYSPPIGQPLIGGVAPVLGPPTGGTLMTINGVNFTSPATVLIGGQLASNITVLSPSQITCQTPPSTSYGSAKVIVQTADGNATNVNGFAYGFSNGTNIDLVASMGGTCFATALQGNYAYVGEGGKLLVLDVSSPSNPSKIGQITLPGTIRAIAFFSHYAYVAAEEGGVQVVDISTPTTPILSGSFPNSDYTSDDGIYIFGGIAYVANANKGLQILDLSNPAIPTLLSSTNIGDGEAVIVKATANGVFAYVSTVDKLAIVDVSNPVSPALRGETSINNGFCYSIALSGNYVYAASLAFGSLEIIDVTNPDAPSDIGPAAAALPAINSVGVANNYLYAASWVDGKGFYVFSINGSTLTQVGNVPHGFGDGNNLALSGTTAYIPDSSGIKIINIANPNSPSQLTTFTDSGVFRSYNSVALTENALAACGSPQGTVLGFYSVFDVSNPTSPTLAASPNLAGTFVRGRNGLAYVLSPNSNSVVDISTPSSTQLLKLISNTLYPGFSMAMSGNTLYAVGMNGPSQPRLVAIDVTTPSLPAVQGSREFPEFGSGTGAATSIGVVGTKALVGIQMDGSPAQFKLVCMNVSNLGAMAIQSIFTDVPSHPTSIELSANGNYGYVLCAGSPSSLAVLDISQPTTPTLVTNIVLDSNQGTGTAIKGSELFVTTRWGLYVFDISNGSTPKLVRSHVASGALSVSVSTESPNQSGYIYVADGVGGILVFKEQDIQAPTVFITNPTFASGYTNSTSTVNLGGGSDDNTAVTKMSWANNRGGSGQINAPFDNWFVSGITLFPGSNVLSVTAFDASGNAGSKTLMVYSQVPKQNQTITFSAIPDTTYGAGPLKLTAAASSGLPVSFAIISGPASVSGNNLTLLGAGPITVEASQLGNDLFNSAPPVDVTFNVARAAQSIDFGLLADKSAGDPMFPLTAVASSGLPVFFSVISGPASIDSSNLTLAGSGPVVVVAWQPGNSNFDAAATVQRSFNVMKIPQTITFGALASGKVGDAPFPLNALASSGLAVNYSVSGPVILSGNILTVVGPGTVSVTASQPGNNTYSAASDVVQSFTIIPPDNTLVGLSLQQGSGFQLAFFGTYGSNYTIQGSSNLLNWDPLTNFVSTNSPTYFIDPGATNRKLRYYRAVGQ